MALRGPARLLLRDYDGLCRKATLALYLEGIGMEVKEKDLVPLTVESGASTPPAGPARRC